MNDFIEKKEAVPSLTEKCQPWCSSIELKCDRLGFESHNQVPIFDKSFAS